MSPREHAARLRRLPPAADTQTAKLVLVGELARVLLVHGEDPVAIRAAQDKALKNDVEAGACPSFEAA